VSGSAPFRRRRFGVFDAMCALTCARRSAAVVEEGDASLRVGGGALSPAMVTSVKRALNRKDWN
jgi:hypothetical protein